MAGNTARSTKKPRRKGRIALRFKNTEALEGTDEEIHRDLSAAARSGDTLFVACDETAGVDILRPVGMEGRGAGRRAVWGDHFHVPFGDLIDLPAGADGEMDIEGLAVDDGWLWAVGSQSITRGEPGGDVTPAEGMAQLARTKFDKTSSTRIASFWAAFRWPRRRTACVPYSAKVAGARGILLSQRKVSCANCLKTIPF